jgi:hypothetical protein
VERGLNNVVQGGGRIEDIQTTPRSVVNVLECALTMKAMEVGSVAVMGWNRCRENVGDEGRRKEGTVAKKTKFLAIPQWGN